MNGDIKSLISIFNEMDSSRTPMARATTKKYSTVKRKPSVRFPNLKQLRLKFEESVGTGDQPSLIADIDRNNAHNGLNSCNKVKHKVSDSSECAESTAMAKLVVAKPVVPAKPLRVNPNKTAEPSGRESQPRNWLNSFNQKSHLNHSSSDTPKSNASQEMPSSPVLSNKFDDSINSVVIRESDAKISDPEVRLSISTSDYFSANTSSDRNSFLSMSSFSSFSDEYPDVVIRRSIKGRPTPRERTSLNRCRVEPIYFSFENEANDVSKQLRFKEEIESNDLISWQNDDSNNLGTDFYDSVNDNDIYDESEHLYEELHRRSTMVNFGNDNYDAVNDREEDWVDIGNDKSKIEVEVVLRKAPITSHGRHGSRKSRRPKSCIRQSAKPVPNRLEVPKEHKELLSDSGTEYEDIDDDFANCATECEIYTENCVHNNVKNNSLIDDKAEDHIYESLPEFDSSKCEFITKDSNPFNTEFLKEISASILKKNSVADSRGQRKGSIDEQRYSLTPRQDPKFIHHNKTEAPEDIVLRRSQFYVDSQVSRNSSIYIQPEILLNSDTDSVRRLSLPTVRHDSFIIPYVNIRAQNFHKQNSVTGSVVSYLEFTGPPQDVNSSPFVDEPLYQFYQKDICRRAEFWINADRSVTEYDCEAYENECIYGVQTGNVCTIQNCKHILCNSHNSAVNFTGSGALRSLWCQLPQVINSKSNILKTISDKDRQLQEAMFEIITSEASYLKSLDILVNHFYNCPDLSGHKPQILSARERQSLFSNIIEVHNVSHSLFTDLENRFQQNILLYDICDILHDYAVRDRFKPYVHYCAYQRDQEKLLNQLRISRPAFNDTLQRLESNQVCQMQTLCSFIMLPIQRITRYPLLVDAVCQRLSADSLTYKSSRKALNLINKLTQLCNEEANKVQRMQELIDIGKKLRFGKQVKSYPIVSGSRYLVKSASVVRLKPQISSKKSIGKNTTKWSKTLAELLLFSDLLILAKKKSDGQYSVFDYCLRDRIQLLTVSKLDENYSYYTLPQNCNNLANLMLFQNHQGKAVEHIINFNLESEKLRWIEAVSPPVSDNPQEIIYEKWDCPQVQCIRSYLAKQTDELSLNETDVVNVYRKMSDGWFEGERIRDGVKGWFPSSFTEEIVNEHVIARNLRFRYRLLKQTESYLEDHRKSVSSLFSESSTDC